MPTLFCRSLWLKTKVASLQRCHNLRVAHLPPTEKMKIPTLKDLAPRGPALPMFCLAEPLRVFLLFPAGRSRAAARELKLLPVATPPRLWASPFWSRRLTLDHNQRSSGEESAVLWGPCRLTALSSSLPPPAEARVAHGWLGGTVRVGSAGHHLRAGRACLLPALGGGHARLLRLGCRRPGTPRSQGGVGPLWRREASSARIQIPEAWSRVPDLPPSQVRALRLMTVLVPVLCGSGRCSTVAF